MHRSQITEEQCTGGGGGAWNPAVKLNFFPPHFSCSRSRTALYGIGKAGGVEMGWVKFFTVVLVSVSLSPAVHGPHLWAPELRQELSWDLVLLGLKEYVSLVTELNAILRTQEIWGNEWSLAMGQTSKQY